MEEGTINTNFVTRGRLEQQCEQGKIQPVEEGKELMDSGFCRHYDSHESHTATSKSEFTSAFCLCYETQSPPLWERLREPKPQVSLMDWQNPTLLTSLSDFQIHARCSCVPESGLPIPHHGGVASHGTQARDT